MTPRKPAAPMPDSIRHSLRAAQHPARAVACPRCGAHEHRPCTTPSKKRLLPAPHPVRVSEWVRTTACCPTCQVEPGIDCHLDGIPLPDRAVHHRREIEAGEMAA